MTAPWLAMTGERSHIRSHMAPSFPVRWQDYFCYWMK